jgi:hypothetical protein
MRNKPGKAFNSSNQGTFSKPNLACLVKFLDMPCLKVKFLVGIVMAETRGVARARPLCCCHHTVSVAVLV